MEVTLRKERAILYGVLGQGFSLLGSKIQSWLSAATRTTIACRLIPRLLHSETEKNFFLSFALCSKRFLARIRSFCPLEGGQPTNMNRSEPRRMPSLKVVTLMKVQFFNRCFSILTIVSILGPDKNWRCSRRRWGFCLKTCLMRSSEHCNRPQTILIHEIRHPLGFCLSKIQSSSLIEVW